MQPHVVHSFDRLSPTVNYAGLTVADPGYAWGPRLIPDYHLIYVVSGTAELRLAGSSFELRSGDIGLYGRETPMMLRASAGLPAFIYYSIHFDWQSSSAAPVHPSSRMRYCKESQMNGDPVPLALALEEGAFLELPFSARAPQLKPLFRLLAEDYQEQSFGYELALRGRLSLLLAELVRFLREGKESETKRKIAPALQLIQQQSDRAWQVSELANACGYQPAYFAELFKKALGLTPKAYIIERRIRLAKQMLLAGEAIDVISDRLGYGGSPYFHRSFKEATGMTPSEFRMGGR